jgi:hypothetical protein
MMRKLELRKKTLKLLLININLLLLHPIKFSLKLNLWNQI